MGSICFSLIHDPSTLNWIFPDVITAGLIQEISMLSYAAGLSVRLYGDDGPCGWTTHWDWEIAVLGTKDTDWIETG